MMLTYNGQEIQQRELDNFVNLTQMAKANEVNINDWYKTQATKAYIQELESETNKVVSELLIVKKGGVSSQQGTWAHPLLALNFGRWISPKFAIWCDKHIKTLLETGSTSLVPQTFSEALLLAGKIQQEKELLEIENSILEKENHTLCEIVDELFDYSSIIRISKYNKIIETAFSWRKLKAASIKLGKEIKKVPDARFGTKNLYHHEAWRLAYPEMPLPEFDSEQE